MIIPLEIPPKIVLTGNPVVARLASDNYITEAGTPAVFAFRFSAEEANDRYLAFNSPIAGAFVFTFKTTLDPNSPTDLRLKGAFSFEIWMQTIKAALESNYYLERHYFLSNAEIGGQHVVKLVAKQPGTAYNITVTESTVEHLVTETDTAGTDRTVRDNFRILVETYTRDLINFRLRGQGDLIAVDKNGVGLAQVNAYLEERLAQQFSWPPQALTPVGFRNQLAARSFLKYGESYGQPEQIYKLTKGTEFISLQGRIPKKRLPDFLANFSNIHQYFVTTKRFLTWQPLIKETYASSPEKLYWLHFYENIAQIKIRMKRVFNDGTSSTSDLTSIFTTTPYTVVEIETSASIIAANVANLAELHIWIAQPDNSIISAVQAYILKPEPAVLHHFLFENAWGAYDTASFNGELMEEDEYTHEVEEVFKPQLYAPSQRRFRNLRTNQKEHFTVNSGFNEDADWLLWLDDLFNAPSIFEVITGRLHEVLIENGTIFKKRSKEFVRSLSFKYQRFSPEQVYRVAPSPVFNLEPQIDPLEPNPQFSTGLVVGLAGFDELYFPGNAWLDLAEPITPSMSFTLTSVLKIDQGNVVLFSSDTHSISVSGDGESLWFAVGETAVEVPLEVDIRNKYILLQIAVFDDASVIVLINGHEEASQSIAPIDELAFDKFGHKDEDATYFKGRLVELMVGGEDELANNEARLAIAERLGLPVPGVNWLQEYDAETREFIISNFLTRDDVTTGYIEMTRAEMPYFDPAPGGYVAPYPVGVRTNVFGGVVHVTTDGSDPDSESSILDPEEFINIEANTEIKAIVIAEGFLPSQIATAVFTLQPAAAPSIIPMGGEFNTPKFFEILPAIEEQTCHFTIDGSEPTVESDVFDPENTLPLTAPQDEIAMITMKAIATGAGYGPSPVAQAEFEISGFTYGFMLEFAVSGSEAGRTVTLPFTAGVMDNYIDWGDGSELTHITLWNGSDRIHTYAEDGVYVVKITGDALGFSFSNSGDRNKLTRIVHWGDEDKFEGFTTLASAFYGCSNLVSLGAGKIRATTPTIQMSAAFRNTAIVEVPEGIFDELEGPSVFDMFRDCSSLVTIPGSLFRYCTGISNFLRTFQDCSSIVEIPEDLFRYNTAMTSSSSFNSTFQGCLSLEVVPVDLFRYNTSVPNFTSCFRGCSSLEEIPVDLFRYNVNVGSSAFNGTFRDSGLTSLPPALFRYNVNAISSAFNDTFRDCLALQIRADIFFNPGEESTRFLNKSVAFNNCFNRWGSYTGIQGTAPNLWDCDFGTGTPGKTGVFGGTANDGTSLDNYDDIPSDWK